MKKEVILKNVELGSVYEPEQDKTLYSVLVKISDEQQEQLLKEIEIGGKKGINSETGEEYENYSFYGKFFDNIPIVDKGLKKIEDGISKLTNAKVDLKVYKYKWSYAKKSGESIGILAIRVVEEGSGNLDGFDKEETIEDELGF